jgi:hypothetical protein
MVMPLDREVLSDKALCFVRITRIKHFASQKSSQMQGKNNFKFQNAGRLLMFCRVSISAGNPIHM